MNTDTLRSQLHDYIEKSDDRHLDAIFVLVEKEIISAYKCCKEGKVTII